MRCLNPLVCLLFFIFIFIALFFLFVTIFLFIYYLIILALFTYIYVFMDTGKDSLKKLMGYPCPTLLVRSTEGYRRLL